MSQSRPRGEQNERHRDQCVDSCHEEVESGMLGEDQFISLGHHIESERKNDGEAGMLK